MQTYRTSQIAAIIGVHPNTVRLYEELGLIPRVERGANGYRVFTELHIQVFKLARVAFQIEVLQGGLRKKIIEVVKTTANGDYEGALKQLDEYLEQVRKEQEHAKEAIRVVQSILAGERVSPVRQLTRKEAASHLQITVDTLRNWERNGLLEAGRRENGYPVYTGKEIDRLIIIRSLRCANYSLEAILRMLLVLSKNPQADIESALESTGAEDDILSVCDKLLTSLKRAEENGLTIRQMLLEIFL